jgi:hypothetical protein
MGRNGVVKRQKRNPRPQNTPILNGGFRADVVSTRSSLSFAEFLMREPNAHFSSATLIRRGRLTAILECGLKNLFTASESFKSLDPNDH